MKFNRFNIFLYIFIFFFFFYLGYSNTFNVEFNDGSSQVAIGEYFNISVEINFLENSTNVSLTGEIPSYVSLISQENNLNITGLALSNNFTYNLGNFSELDSFQINFTAYVLDLPFISDGFIFDQSNFNFSFINQSNLSAEIIIQTGDLEVIEPSIDILASPLPVNFDTGDNVNIDLLFSNIINTAYNISTSFIIPDGFSVVSSSYNYSQINNTLFFTFNDSSFIEDISLVLNADSLYQNLSPVLIEDAFIFDYNISYFSSENQNISREYFFSDFFELFLNSFTFSLDYPTDLVAVGTVIPINLSLFTGSNQLGLQNVTYDLPFAFELDNYTSSQPVFLNISENKIILDYSSNAFVNDLELILYVVANSSLYAEQFSTSSLNFTYLDSQDNNFQESFTVDFTAETPSFLLSENVFNITIGEIFQVEFSADFTDVSAINSYLNLSLPFSLQLLNFTSNNLSFTIFNDSLLINTSDILAPTFYNFSFTFIVNDQFFNTSVDTFLDFYYETPVNNFNIFENIIINVSEPDINIWKNNPGNVNLNQSFTYDINLFNMGNSTAFNLTMTETIPLGTDLLSVSIPYFLSGPENRTLNFNLSDLPAGDLDTITIELFVNDVYPNGNLLYARDALALTSSLSYFSLNNSPFAKSYTTNSNRVSRPRSPDITYTTSGHGSFFNGTLIRVGDIFNYSILLDFTDAPARDVFLEVYLNETLSFFTQENSFDINSSSFSILNNTLIWDFGTLNNTDYIWINYSVYVNESLPVSFGEEIFNIMNFSIRNTQNQRSYQDENLTVFLAEPQIRINRVEGHLLARTLVNRTRTYNLNISNTFNPTQDFHLSAFNVSVVEVLPDGFAFNSSTIIPDFVNSTHVIWVFPEILPNQIINLPITITALDRYQNGSSTLAEDFFINRRFVEYYSSLNSNLSRFYTTNFSSPSLRMASPTIEHTITTSDFSIGDLVIYEIFLNFSRAPANNVSFTSFFPFGLNLENISSSGENISFDITGNTLRWEFGDLTDAKIINLNISGYINDSLFLADVVTHSTNLNYQSSNLNTFNIVSNRSFIVTEPNIVFNGSLNPVIFPNQTFTYNFTLYNNQTSNAFKVDLFHLIPNGTSFISTNIVNYTLNGTFNDSLYLDLGIIAPLDEIFVEVTVNTSNFYRDLQLIKAGDSFDFYFNYTYQSVLNEVLGRQYFYEETLSSQVILPQTDMITETSALFQNNPALKFGEIFNYTYIINFSGAPANNVSLENLYPLGFNFVGFNSTFNNTNLTNFGNRTLLFEFGNLTPNDDFINLTLWFYLQKNSSNLAGDIFTNFIDLRYYNTSSVFFNYSNSINNRLIENNINIFNTLLNTQTIVPGDIIAYELNISNFANNGLSLNSTAYNVTLLNIIPDGFIYHNSTLVPTTLNNTEIFWELGNIDIGTVESILLSFVLNQTYLNSSFINSQDLFRNEIFVFTQSTQDFNLSKYYNFSSFSSPILASPPILNSSLNTSLLRIGKEVLFEAVLDFTEILAKNVSFEVEIPFGLEILNITSDDNLSFLDLGNTLNFGFGDLTVMKNYTVNLTLISNSSMNRDDVLNLRSNLSYFSSNNSYFDIINNDAVTIIEPNLVFSFENSGDNLIGERVIFQGNITNIGNAIAENLTVFSLLANGTSFVTSSFGLINLTSNLLEYNINQVGVSEEILFDIEVDVENLYSSGFYVLTQDILDSFINFSYFSSTNYNFSKQYFDALNSSFRIIEPNFLLNDNVTYKILNSSVIRHGEIFNFSLFFNFSDRPTTNLLVELNLSDDLSFFSEDNSINNLSFSNLGNILFWNFTSVLPPVDELAFINLSVYLNNDSSLINEDFLNKSFIINFRNSSNVYFTEILNSTFRIVEPNVEISFSTDTPIAQVGSSINYTINISNNDRGTNFNAEGYRLNLNLSIPDGVSYVNSTIGPFFNNSNILIFNWSEILVNDSILFNITFNVDTFLDNGSINNLDFYSVDSNLDFLSLNNESLAKKSQILGGFNISRTDITPPTILNYTISPLGVPLFFPVFIEISAEDEIELSSCYAQVVSPLTNTSYFLYELCPLGDNFNFTNESVFYDVYLYANDTFNNIAVLNDTFEVGNLVVFELDLETFNSTNIFFDVEFYLNNLLYLNLTNVSGNVLTNLSIFNKDILFKVFNNSLEVRFNGIQPLIELNKGVGFDKFLGDNNREITYAISTDLNFTNSSVRLSYLELNYSDINRVRVEVCDNWNLSQRQCLSSWTLLDTFRNDNLSSFIFNRSSFSAFRIYEFIPSSGGGGAGGGAGGSSSSINFPSGIGDNNDGIYEENIEIGCVENWVCSEWGACLNETKTRTCEDMNACGRNSSMPEIQDVCTSNLLIFSNTSISNIFDENSTVYKVANKEVLIGFSLIELLMSFIYLFLFLIIFKIGTKISKPDFKGDFLNKKKVYLFGVDISNVNFKIIIILTIIIFLTIFLVMTKSFLFGIFIGSFLSFIFYLLIHFHYINLR